MTAALVEPQPGSVDVVIVTYGNVETIGSTVDRLADQPDVRSVVVVDHGTDGAAEAARRHGATVLVDPSNPGFGRGVNRGVRSGAAPFVLLFNPDAVLEPGAIEAGLSALTARPGVAAVTGITATATTGELERAGGKELGPIDLVGRAFGAKRWLRVEAVASLVARVPWLAHQVDRGTERARTVETVSGAAMLIRRTAFESVGGFDEGFFLYGEDLDLCRRLRDHGWVLLYLPVPWAVHDNGASSASWSARELRWWEGTMRFASRWWGPWRFGGGLLAAAVAAGRVSAGSPRLAGTAWRAMVCAPLRERRAGGADRPAGGRLR